jgi:hypothetical protein
VHIYIGFETLKVKCTQYGICSQAAFKIGRAMFFLFSGGAGSYFRAGLKKIRAGAEFLLEGCPCPNLESLLLRRGVLNVLLSLTSGVYLFFLILYFFGKVSTLFPLPLDLK